MRREVPGLYWSDAQLLPTFQAISQLVVYDLRGASRDEQIAATCIAGLANRPQPCVYLICSEDDVFWLQQAGQAVTQRQDPHVVGSAALQLLLSDYRAVVQGLIIYDPELPDTINIATTMAGLQDGMVVSPTLAEILQTRERWPVLADLRTYRWGSRLEAYQWAVQQLLPQTSSRIIAGLDPGAFCGLRSFLVATNAFVYWLDSRWYVRSKTVGRLSERRLLQHILASYAIDAVHLGWVIHEQSGVSLASEVGMAVVASDYVMNLEVWTALQPEQMPLPIRKPALPALEKHIYVSFTMSDGDNFQYCQHRLRSLWQDPARGELPLGWTFSPLLWQAAPVLTAYYMRTATENDELVAGPSGLGYMYPSRWPGQHLATFLQRTGTLMQAMGMTTINVLDVDPLYRTGLPVLAAFSWNGMRLSTSRLQQLFAGHLAAYGVQGILTGAGFTGRPGQWKKVENLFFYNNPGFTASVEQTVHLITTVARLSPQRPLFLNVYIIAWDMTPSQVKEVMQQLGSGYTCVLPRTLFALRAATRIRTRRH